MKKDLILELDDTRVRVLLCARARKSPEILLARSYTLGDGPASALLAQVVEQALDGYERADISVLLAISDRRLVQGVVRAGATPSARDLPALLEAETQKVGMFAEGDHLTIGYVELPKRTGWSAAFEASPRALVSEFLEALQSCGFARVRITSIESVLAAGLAQGPEPVAIADIRSDRARVLVARDGVVLASRKVRLTYMMGGFEAVSTVLAPLRAEIRRSLAFFEEGGTPAATSLMVLGEIPAEEFEDPAWKETFGVPCSRSEVPELAGLPEVVTNPLTWSVVALGPRILRARVPWLVEPARAFELRKVAQMAGQGAAALALLAGAYLSWLEYERFLQVDRGELAQTRARLSITQEVVRELELRQVKPRIVLDRQAIVAAARPALPASRLCAVIAKGSGVDVRFTSLRLDEHSVDLKGVVTAEDDLTALASFGEIDRAVAALPGVGSGSGRLLGRAGAGVRFEYTARLGTKE